MGGETNSEGKEKSCRRKNKNGKMKNIAKENKVGDRKKKWIGSDQIYELKLVSFRY